MEKVREAKRQLRKAYQTDEWDWIIECQIRLHDEITSTKLMLAYQLRDFVKGYDWYTYNDIYTDDTDALVQIINDLGVSERFKGIVDYLNVAVDDDEDNDNTIDLRDKIVEYGKEMGLWTEEVTTN